MINVRTIIIKVGIIMMKVILIIRIKTMVIGIIIIVTIIPIQ